MSRAKRKKLLILSAGLIFVLFLTGLTGGLVMAQDKVTLTYWGWPDTDRLHSNHWAPLFAKVYPEIKIEVKATPMPYPEVHSKLLMALKTGMGAPDICCVGGANIQQLIYAGGLLDLTDRMEPVREDFPGYKIVNESDEKGRLFAVPLDAGPTLLYVRKDVFDKYGIPLSIATWDEYIDVGKKLEGAGHCLATYKKGSGESTLFNLIYHQQGKVYFNREGNPTFNSSEAKKTLGLVKRMIDADILLDVKLWSPAWYSALKGGKIVAWPMAVWQANDLIYNIKTEEEGAGKWRIALLPAFEEGGPRVSNLGGSSLVIPKQSDHIKEAWLYVKWATTSIEARKAELLFGEFPAWYPIYNHPSINTPVDFFGGQLIWKEFAEAMKGMPTFHYSRYYFEATEMMESEFAKYFRDEVSLEKTLEKIQSRLLKLSRG